MKRLGVVPIIAGMCLNAPLSAQPVTQGSRVRVTSDSLTLRVEGEVVDLDGQHLVVNPTSPEGLRGAPLTLTWGQVSRIEVSRGQRSTALKGALIGAGIGAGVGGLTFLGCGNEDRIAGFTCGGAALATVGMVGLGAVVGALISSGGKKDRWEEVPLESIRVQPLISLFPLPNQRLLLSWGFRLRL